MSKPGKQTAAGRKKRAGKHVSHAKARPYQPGSRKRAGRRGVVDGGNPTGAVESRVLPDSNLLNGESLARVEYRREGQRRWRHFLVVLDDDTTFELVEENVEAMIAVYEAQRPGKSRG